MAFKMKGFKPHNMYDTQKAETHKEHLALKEKGYDHSPYNKKTLDHTNTKCWPGKKKVGTKMSSTRPGVRVNDCE
tara:strand:+ start:646 stop:870 length:225 start_codon:yes stop_codon:yes gene_type:complete